MLAFCVRRSRLRREISVLGGDRTTKRKRTFPPARSFSGLLKSSRDGIQRSPDEARLRQHRPVPGHPTGPVVLSGPDSLSRCNRGFRMFQIWRRLSSQVIDKHATETRRLRRCARPQLALEPLEDRLVPSTLIPVSNHRDLVFDPIRGLLDITTSSGSVQQFSVNAQQLIAGIKIAGTLNGSDIS